ncbi:MAG TPA: M14 family zinc carboxypeptidase [Elusimicrobiota bacterium]|nr:M14 family zinc carboxypeptidase [Elusimicrobiota bacterium]
MILLPVVLAGWAAAAAVEAPFPSDPANLSRTVSMDEMSSFLQSVDGKGAVTVSVEGKSRQGRPLYLVRLARPGAKPGWRLLFYAQQHGGEVAGKDAALYLIRDAARDPKTLPPDAEIYVVPSVNPDGAVAGTRESASGADLNRDHITLEEPEVQILHRILARLRPHAAFDCHEFDRDGYAEKGWSVWPSITMDNLNNPLFDPALIAIGRRWVEQAGKAVEARGFPFYRYFVGGVPPNDEIRHSDPGVDSAINSMGMHGGLSFIIESASHRGAEGLGRRVGAYRAMFSHILGALPGRGADLRTVEESRARVRPLTDIPTNYFWANVGWKTVEFPVLELASGKRLGIPTKNLMSELVVKKTVPAPRAYAVPAEHAAVFRAMLERQEVPFEVLASSRSLRVEASRLLRFEEEGDDFYGRYGGRQLVARDAPAPRTFAAGSLLVALEGEAAARAALLLEPTQMFGLYAYARYRAMLDRNGTCPVWRVPR